MFKRSIKNFFELESATAILLFIATILALLIANSEGSQNYFSFFATIIPLKIELLNIEKNLSLKDWINEALMAIFFFLIGLELKKEILVGELSSFKKIVLPAFAAIGGVIFPALIFIYFNFNHQENLRGFAIPTATDIAFAYGIICFFGKKIPNSLKVFIITLAVLDDLIAIVIIAVFYTQKMQISYLFLLLPVLLFLFFLHQKKSDRISIYLLSGVVLWLLILQSGVHATLSGVILAIFIPLQVSDNNHFLGRLKLSAKDFLESLAHRISPLVNFLILPAFAFANSGVKILKFDSEILLQPISLGIICGLFFGKQIGVMLFSFLAVKFKFASLPQESTRQVSWFQFYAVSIFTGIGFTMSLFIGELSFLQKNTTSEMFEIILDQVKIGILIASTISIIFGSFLLSISIKTAK